MNVPVIGCGGNISLVTSSFNKSTGELTIGAATTINQTIELLRQYAAVTPAHESQVVTESDSSNGAINHRSVFSVTANHLSLIANTQVAEHVLFELIC